MARLTREEKYRIQEGLLEGLTVSEIAEKLTRTVSAVTKYRDEFQKLANTFATRETDSMKKAIVEPTPTNDGVVISDDVILATIHKLKLNGVKKDDATSALNTVISNLTERIDDPARLHAMCMQKLSVHNSMITEAVGGREGVAVMTGTASQIIDEKKKSGNRGVASERKCLFNPKTGKVT